MAEGAHPELQGSGPQGAVCCPHPRGCLGKWDQGPPLGRAVVTRRPRSGTRPVSGPGVIIFIKQVKAYFLKT